MVVTCGLIQLIVNLWFTLVKTLHGKSHLRLVTSLYLQYLVHLIQVEAVQQQMEQLIDLQYLTHLQLLQLVLLVSMESFRNLTLDQASQARDSFLLATTLSLGLPLLTVLAFSLLSSDQQSE